MQQLLQYAFGIDIFQKYQDASNFELLIFFSIFRKMNTELNMNYYVLLFHVIAFPSKIVREIMA